MLQCWQEAVLESQAQPQLLFAISSKNVLLVSNNKGKIAASTLTINNFQPIVTGGATTITDYTLTANNVVISDAIGQIGTSSVSNIEVGYLVGTTSLIQNQLNSKANQSTTYNKT